MNESVINKPKSKPFHAIDKKKMNLKRIKLYIKMLYGPIYLIFLALVPWIMSFFPMITNKYSLWTSLVILFPMFGLILILILFAREKDDSEGHRIREDLMIYRLYSVVIYILVVGVVLVSLLTLIGTFIIDIGGGAFAKK